MCKRTIGKQDGIRRRKFQRLAVRHHCLGIFVLCARGSSTLLYSRNIRSALKKGLTFEQLVRLDLERLCLFHLTFLLPPAGKRFSRARITTQPVPLVFEAPKPPPRQSPGRSRGLLADRPMRNRKRVTKSRPSEIE